MAPMTTRVCGPCDLCCTALGIDEEEPGRLPIHKPARVPCQHLAINGGCSIYHSDRKPLVCSAFRCGWLEPGKREWLREDERPDRLGVIFAAARPGAPFERSTGIRPLVAYEVRPGALESWAVEKVLNRLRRHFLVALSAPGKVITFTGPPGALAQAHRYVAERGDEPGV